MSFLVVIPARHASTRLPGKPLLEVGGKAMVLHVLEKAKAAGAIDVWVATDDGRIEALVQGAGGQVMMTSPDHESGTDRLAEVAERLGLADDAIVVNVQGDEPLVPPAVIRQVAELLEAHPQAAVATLATPIHDLDEAVNPNAVKVVTDKNGLALYFSRASIPAQRARLLAGEAPQLEGGLLRRHLGIYAYRAGFLRRYAGLAVSPLEQLEALEQLRVLWHGERIVVADACELPPAGIDTPADLERVNRLLEQ
ncbi:3-deoxy-manno-octulosonate cytidylyltransferase [Gallaecimonas kandeliae]|uniref:3-deoxy-manno-octulosonate cytidylyltransferase n=1 Tax=Gallaecimonas kandeliae TaxID=3029055 RepID=UPI0026484656|nr:3-deoxy-manno-octulosonate cytidylyltransferase [Gallaecimonas kandeliae]WKE67051.1 3-deoxy-manno-octulosonate cytidylyltransferase [Gallaecimonas kandeliae]